MIRLWGRLTTYSVIFGVSTTLLVVGIVVPLTLSHRSDPGGSVFVGPSQSTASPLGELGASPYPMPSAPPSVTPTSSASQSQGSDPFSDGHSSYRTPRPPGVKTASDQGITPTSIKLGILLVSFGSANKIGAGVSGYDPDVQKRYFSGYIDAVNARGGVFGRRINPVYYTVDILNSSTFTAACQSLVDSQHVFAVLNVLGVYGSGILCFTQQKHTPYLSVDGAVSSYYRSSNGLLFTLSPSTLVTNKNAVDVLQASGELKDRKVGLVNEGDYLTADFNAVASYLSATVGYSAPHATISALDTTQAARDIPGAVSRMRAAGVKVVLLQTNELYAQEFASVANDQGYFPAYAETDFDYEMAGNSFLKSQPRRYFDHAISVSSTRVGDADKGIPEKSSARSCRLTYNRANSANLDPRTDTYYAALGGCDLIRLLVDGLSRAGLNPTRRSFSEGIHTIGAVEYAGIGDTSFSAARFTAPDSVRLNQADYSCRCWRPLGTGAFRRASYTQ